MRHAALALLMLAAAPASAARFLVGVNVVSSSTVSADVRVGRDGSLHVQFASRGAAPAAVQVGSATPSSAPASGELRLASSAPGDVVVTLLY